MSSDYDKFLQRMTQYRVRMGLTQNDISDLIGVTQSQFSKMELGKTVISFQTLKLLLQAGWDIDYIIIGKENRVWTSSLTDYLETEVGSAWIELREILLWVLGNAIGCEELTDEAEWPAHESFKEPKTESCKDRTFEEVRCEYALLKLILGRPITGSILRQIRQTLGVAQGVMAEHLGVNIKKYRDLERGNVNPDAQLLSLIYDISGCRPGIFFRAEKTEKYLLNDLWNRIDQKRQQDILLFLRHAEQLRRKS